MNMIETYWFGHIFLGKKRATGPFADGAIKHQPRRLGHVAKMLMLKSGFHPLGNK